MNKAFIAGALLTAVSIVPAFAGNGIQPLSLGDSSWFGYSPGAEANSDARFKLSRQIREEIIQQQAFEDHQIRRQQLKRWQQEDWERRQRDLNR